MTSKIISVIFAVTILFVQISYAADADPVLAKAGDYVIKNSDLERIISYYPPDKRKLLQDNPKQKVALVKRIMEVKVIADISRKEGFDKSLVIEEQLSMIVNNFLATEYISKEVVKDVTVTDKEMEQYYEINKDKFSVPVQIHARHILIKAASSATDEEKKKAKAKAEEILEKLKKGGDFAKLAEEYSEDPSKAKGGDLGYFARNKMVKTFEDAAFALKPGEISGIVETPFGYHIIKIEDVKEARIKPFAEVKNKLAEQLTNEIKKGRGSAFLDKALKHAGMEIYEEAIIGQPLKKTDTEK
jgi:peptidyl-prolyl cis-trans isomerase C